MTMSSWRSRARKRRSTAAAMFGSRKGSASCLRRGLRKRSMAAGSLKPRFKRHWARRGEILKAVASWPASSGCAGANDQRNLTAGSLKLNALAEAIEGPSPVVPISERRKPQASSLRALRDFEVFAVLALYVFVGFLVLETFSLWIELQ